MKTESMIWIFACSALIFVGFVKAKMDENTNPFMIHGLMSDSEIKADTLTLLDPLLSSDTKLQYAIILSSIFAKLSVTIESRDFPLDDGSLTFEHIKHPGSCKASIVQAQNKGFWAFREAHNAMYDTILMTSGFQDSLKDILFVLTEGTREDIRDFLPLVESSLQEMANKSSMRQQKVNDGFTELHNLLIEMAKAMSQKINQPFMEDAFGLVDGITISEQSCLVSNDSFSNLAFPIENETNKRLMKNFKDVANYVMFKIENNIDRNGPKLKPSFKNEAISILRMLKSSKKHLKNTQNADINLKKISLHFIGDLKYLTLYLRKNGATPKLVQLFEFLKSQIELFDTKQYKKLDEIHSQEVKSLTNVIVEVYQNVERTSCNGTFQIDLDNVPKSKFQLIKARFSLLEPRVWAKAYIILNMLKSIQGTSENCPQNIQILKNKLNELKKEQSKVTRLALFQANENHQEIKSLKRQIIRAEERRRLKLNETLEFLQKLKVLEKKNRFLTALTPKTVSKLLKMALKSVSKVHEGFNHFNYFQDYHCLKQSLAQVVKTSYENASNESYIKRLKELCLRASVNSVIAMNHAKLYYKISDEVIMPTFGKLSLISSDIGSQSTSIVSDFLEAQQFVLTAIDTFGDILNEDMDTFNEKIAKNLSM